jgi:ATP-binding cassette, subfamily C, bacterial CydCD
VKLSDFSGVTRGTLYLLGVISAVKAAALVGVALGVASGIASVIDGTDTWRTAALLALVSGLTRALIAWAQRVVAARALLGAKERLRAQLADAVLDQQDVSIGSTTTLATRGLDELDKYFTVFLPALINAAVLPLLVGAVILFSDWLSALVIVLTIPLIPVFMALIGMHTRDRVSAATDALGRLSDHLVELARGLPVLVGLGRAEEQLGALRTISDQYRIKTVATLRTAFLSSFALELIATISVALVAVTIGVRLVGGSMTLDIGLFVLLLAPECFGPFRDVGAAFHASDEGREAARRVTEIVARPRGRSLLAEPGPVGVAADGEIRVTELTVRHPERFAPTLSGLSFVAPRHAITLLDGASGSGKTTVVEALAGVLRVRDAEETVSGSWRVSGSISGVRSDTLAWLPQHPQTVADTVLGELLVYARSPASTIHDGVPVGAEAFARTVLDELDLRHLEDANPGLLSPGELRRLAFGGVLMRVQFGATLVLLDEPTAHLDAVRGRIVVDAIDRMRDRATVIVASHDDAVRALADHTVPVVPGAGTAVRRGQKTAPLHGESFDVSVETDRQSHEMSLARPRGIESTEHDRLAQHSALDALAEFLRPQRGRFVAAAALGTAASISAIALTSLSAWLIVRASEQPPIMYLMVAIVGVRFFGIGRAVLRYSERLVSHDAVFAALTGLRMRLWSGLAAEGTRNRAVLSGGTALVKLVRDADEVRDLSIRVVQPIVVGVLTTVVVVAGLGVLQPALLPLLLTLAVAGVIVAPVVALWADRAASRGQQLLRSRVVRRFSALVSAAAQLRANGVDSAVRAELGELDRRATAAARGAALASGLGSAVAIAACGSAAVLVLPLTASAVADGQLSGELLAVLVLTPLGLIDAFLELVAGVQQWPALRDVLTSVAKTAGAATDDHTDRAVRPNGSLAAPESVERLRLLNVAARWPGMPDPVFDSVTSLAHQGDVLVVTGPSGSGKTTLLSILLGHLAPVRGRYLLNNLDTFTMTIASLRQTIAWCPQEGHLFNSTLRANLLVARSRDEAPSDAEMLTVARRVGLGPLLERLPLGLDTPIGAGGGFLSGGERQRVAVARTLLARCSVVLLDEPTAHVDEEGAEALMADLRDALSDTITVLVTHHPIGVAPSDVWIQLGAERTASQMTVDLPTLK